MNALADLVSIDRRGMQLVAAAAGMTLEDLTGLGLPRDRARQLHTAATVLCGTTSHTAYQRRAHTGAATNQHRLDTLAYIARSARTITDTTARWTYIDTLCNTPGDLTHITRVANELKAELQPAPPRPEKVRVTHHGDGMATLRITGPALAIQGVYDAANNNITGWLANDCPKADYLVRVTANLDLGDYQRIIAGTGDDVEVHFANGVITTGEEFVRMQLDELGSIILIGTMDGPVNAYNARFASAKHREIMLADATTCTWKDCTVPATRCQAHHMSEHRHGGDTTPANLGWLCQYHNSQAATGARGHTERRDGQIVYVSPYGNATPTGADHQQRAQHRRPPD